MKCNEITELIPQYVNGELDEDTAKAVKAHVDGCESCKKEYDLWLNIKNDVHEASYEPPITLRTTVLRNVALEKRKRRFNGQLSKLLGAAACVLFIFMAVLLIGRIANVPPSGQQAPPVFSPPELDSFKSFICLSAENDRTSPDSELNSTNLSYFIGEWTGTLKNGTVITVSINPDGSAVTCIRNKWGIENYYDGEFTFQDDDSTHLTQSDGNVNEKAEISVFCVDDKIYFGIINGNITWISEQEVS